MKITAESLESLKPAEKRYYITDEVTKGFTVQVKPTGRIELYHVYHEASRKIRRRLGTYPDINVEDARRLCEQRIQTTKRITKVRARMPRVRCTEVDRERSLRDLVYDYQCSHVEGLADSSAKLYNSMCDITLSQFDSLEDITPRSVRHLLDSMSGTPAQANRYQSVLSSFCRWLLERDYIEFNPALGLRRYKEIPQSRYLAEDQLEKLAVALKASEAMDDVKLAIQLMLVTGCRSGEVDGMRYEELSGSTWLIPAERTKNGRAHVVYLPQCLVDHIGIGTGRVLKCKKEATRGALKRLCVQAKITHTTPHDLRRTAGTLLAKYGVGHEDRARFLNHSPAGVTDRHYNVYDYAQERQAAASVLSTILAQVGILPSA